MARGILQFLLAIRVLLLSYLIILMVLKFHCHFLRGLSNCEIESFCWTWDVV